MNQPIGDGWIKVLRIGLPNGRSSRPEDLGLGSSLNTKGYLLSNHVTTSTVIRPLDPIFPKYPVVLC